MCCNQHGWWLLMAKQDLKEPEEIKEPEVQVLGGESKEDKPEPKPAKKEKIVLKKFAKFAKGK